jgi:hypothetical protein
MRNEMMIDQLIPFHKSNKKVRNEKMMDYLCQGLRRPTEGLRQQQPWALKGD